MATALKNFTGTFDRIVLRPSSKIPKVEHRDARLVTWLAMVSVVAMGLRLLFNPTWTWVAVALVLVVGYGISRTHYRKFSGFLIVVLFAAPSLATLFTEIPTGLSQWTWIANRILWLALPLILASIFFSWRGTLLYGLLVFAALLIAPLVNQGLDFSGLPGALGFVGTIVALLVISLRHRDLVEIDRQAELRSANEALRESEATLEMRVIERTLELEKALKRAEEADKIKSQFLASMSHELRTPLNAILSFSKYMRQAVFGAVNEEQIDYLSKIVDSGDHLLSLINDVLDVTKIQSGMLKLYIENDFDIAEEVQKVVVSAESMLAGKPVKIITDIDEELPKLTCDKRRIRQVIYNLVSNAIKFTEEGSITLSVKKQKDSLLLAVSDTGPGVDPEYQEVIFDPFVQTDTGIKHAGGTGLGLPISKQLTEAHGGTLRMLSEVGDGTQFIVTLPLVASTSVLEKEPAA